MKNVYQKTKNYIIRKAEILKTRVNTVFLYEDKENTEVLRLRIANLTLPTGDSIWDKNRIELRESILNQSLNNFLNWKIIQKAMYHRANLKELEYLKSRSDWNIWKQAIKETKVGNPPDNLNLIHQAYSLSQYFEDIGDLKKLGSIVEAGGGYGCMCRLIYNLGFKEKYTIFDFPEFLLLQDYYLKCHGLSVNLTDDIKELEGEFLIGLWSISEMPIELRDEIFKKFKSYLIAYQDEFEGIDNVKYFNRFQGENYIISHIKHSRYLATFKKERKLEAEYKQ
ncbi:MAG: hypothetical protein HY451_01685 [Parcubacteria group bacterium]|nr:hypothetical protein [Parcubacteria group bacterium]